MVSSLYFKIFEFTKLLKQKALRCESPMDSFFYVVLIFPHVE